MSSPETLRANAGATVYVGAKGKDDLITISFVESLVKDMLSSAVQMYANGLNKGFGLRVSKPLTSRYGSPLYLMIR